MLNIAWPPAWEPVLQLLVSSTQGSASLQAGTDASLVSEVKAAMAGIMGSAPAVSVPAAIAGLQNAICEALGLQVRFLKVLYFIFQRGHRTVLLYVWLQQNPYLRSRKKTVTKSEN